MRKLYPDLFDYLSLRARVIFRNHSLPRWMVFTFDMGAVFLTFLFSYILRFNFELGAFSLEMAIKQSILVVGVYAFFETIYRSFAGMIRHTTIRDIFNVLMTTSSAFAVLLVFTLTVTISSWKSIFNIPGSILAIHYVTLNAFLFISRISVKMFFEMVSIKPSNKKNVIIYGAGAMGVIVKRVISSDTENDYNIVSFLDSDKKLQGKLMDGIPVYNPAKLTREFLVKNNVKTMIFAINDIAPSRKSDIYRDAVDLGLEVLQIPVVSDWLNGTFEVKQLKKIKVQDLLSRDPIQLNMKRIANGLRDKTILVTGAAGSIGSEIVLRSSPFAL